MVNGGHVYIDCIHGTSTSWPTILAAVYFEIMNFNDDDDDNDNDYYYYDYYYYYYYYYS